MTDYRNIENLSCKSCGKKTDYLAPINGMYSTFHICEKCLRSMANLIRLQRQEDRRRDIEAEKQPPP